MGLASFLLHFLKPITGPWWCGLPMSERDGAPQGGGDRAGGEDQWAQSGQRRNPMGKWEGTMHVLSLLACLWPLPRAWEGGLTNHLALGGGVGTSPQECLCSGHLTRACSGWCPSSHCLYLFPKAERSFPNEGSPGRSPVLSKEDAVKCWDRFLCAPNTGTRFSPGRGNPFPLMGSRGRSCPAHSRGFSLV